MGRLIFRVCLCFQYLPGAVFGFQNTNYSVMESEGSLVVFVLLLQGELVFPADLEISDMEISASKLLEHGILH